MRLRFFVHNSKNSAYNTDENTDNLLKKFKKVIDKRKRLMVLYIKRYSFVGGETVEIAIIADDTKKELITQFCIAYCGILSKHSICATSTTGSYISEATGLKIEKLLSGTLGGEQQIASRIAFDEIDILFYFRANTPQNYGWVEQHNQVEQNLLRLCDVHNVLLATNIATAETIVSALERGDLDYRELINPRSEYNIKKRKNKKI